MKVKNILVPVDFSENSRRALEAARDLQAFNDGKLTLLYVLEPLIVSFGEALPGDLPTEAERLAAAETEMERLRHSLGDGVPVESTVADGTAWDVICEKADRENFDLIVIASHGYKGLKRFVLGSTAERVVRHAHCAVLVVKPPLSAAKKS